MTDTPAPTPRKVKKIVVVPDGQLPPTHGNAPAPEKTPKKHRSLFLALGAVMLVLAAAVAAICWHPATQSGGYPNGIVENGHVVGVAKGQVHGTCSLGVFYLAQTSPHSFSDIEGWTSATTANCSKHIGDPVVVSFTKAAPHKPLLVTIGFPTLLIVAFVCPVLLIAGFALLLAAF